MKILEGAEFCVAMRLHTLIYAAKTGTPSIGIVYDPKVSSMLEYTNQSHTIDVDKVSASILGEYANTIIKEKDKLSASLKERSKELTVLAKENAQIASDILK